MAPRSAGKASYVVIALGSNVHIFVRPHRRAELAQCFESVLAAPYGPLSSPASISRCSWSAFPAGDISASSSPTKHPMMSSRAWLELRADDPAAVLQAALGAGLTEVRHPGHPYYFMIPGGQVFTIAPTS